MIPLILAASLLAPSEAPSAFIKAAEGIEAKDGKVSRAAFEEAVRENIRPEHRERLAPIVADFIAHMGARYCPISDPRDKGGLNAHWISNVTKFYKRFAGKNARIR